MSHYEPTSHEYLYEMPKEQLFQLFSAAVNSLVVDERGVWCLPVEAEALQRFSRAVQERTVGAAPGTVEDTLGTVATVTRVMLGYVVSRGDQRPPAAGEQEKIEGQGFCAFGPALGAGIVDRFYAERARLPDLLPAGPAAVSWVSDDIVEDRDPLADHPGTVEGGYLCRVGEPPEPIE